MQFAGHASVPGKPYNEYFGIIATIDVYGHNIRHGQMSASSVMVANLGDGSNETYNSIRVGWMVITDPHLHSNVSHLEKDFIYYNKLFDI